VSVVKEPVAEPATPKLPAADIGQAATKPSGEMLMPTTGKIIREYAKGRNEGIDIGAPAGAPVKAAASGQVAAITRNDDNVQIVVIRHPDDLLTIYTHLDGLTISKGDAVSRGQTIGKVRVGQPSFLHFEIRQGFESVDPMLFLQ
jgi:murein DD-endopeptidase MepM/ murein hydrolase activator NlpD